VSPLCHYKELELFGTVLGVEGENHTQERTQQADQEAERDSTLRANKQAKSKAVEERVNVKEDLIYKLRPIQKEKREENDVWPGKAGD